MIFRPSTRTRATNTVQVLWRWVGSRWFWRVSLVLFVLQALYIAFFGRFSMAYDEYYHLGSIQQYAKVWFPWSVQQPAGPAVIGSVPTDSSYLYHYLMSFPYRLLEHVVSSQTAQIIALRLIDVVIVVAGLYIFRRVLRHMGMSWSALHGLLFVIVCLPMAPFLAGQLTYDALFFTLTALSVLVAVRYARAIRDSHRLPLLDTLLLAALLVTTAQVKYAFLPIALAIVGFTGSILYRELRASTVKLKNELETWRVELRSAKVLIAAALLVATSFLFVMRYGMNMAHYQSPLPKCNVVLGRERCLAYGPYARDDNHVQLRLADALTARDKLTYPLGWIHQMIYESYFAVGSMEIRYPTGKPLPVPFAAGYVLAVAALALVVLRVKTVWRRGVDRQLVLCVVVVYTLFLFAENARAFLSTGVPVAIHGRYLLPLLPLIGYLAYEALRSMKHWPRMRTYVVGLYMTLMLLTFYSGGIMVFIMRSSETWYWQSAQSFTNAVRSMLWPFIIR